MAPLEKAQKRVRHPGNTLTAAQKERRRAKWAALSDDISNAQENYADLAKIIAAKHER
jgi:hypothetical protein